MGDTDWGREIYGGTGATEFLAGLGDPHTAGDKITGALRAVIEPVQHPLSEAAATAGLLAVAVLLMEHEPALAAAAPDPAGLRGAVTAMDSELTPDRRTAAHAVLDRVCVPGDNAWYDAHVSAGTLAGALRAVRELADRLVD